MARSNTLYSVASGARTRLVDRVLWHKLRLVVALLCVIGALFHNGAVALAAGITVTTTADIIDAGANCAAVTLAALPGPGGQTSLREAICAANNTPGADTISFSVNGTFALTGPANDDAGNSGDLDVTDSVTIQGNGAANTIIDGSGNERIFDVYPGAPIMFTVNGLTIQNGDTRSTSFQLGGAIYLHSNVTTSISASQIINNFSGANGAIDNVGTLTISNSVIANNQTIPAAGTVTGGGLRNAGALTISNSTIANNTVRGEGGGIATTTGSGVVVNITNTTISGNTASVTGGGLGNGGGISTTGNDGIINITNSTISGNRADNNGGGAYFTTPTVTGAFNLTNVTINNNTADNDNNGSGVGGGFRLNAGSATLYNTIVAGNFNSTAATRDDINGTVSASSSNNLIGDGTGAAGITNGLNGNQVGSGGSPINPLLGPLANTGGSTETHALLAGSPAIDTASSSFCPATDQRGIPRPGGAACDIGAYELNDITPPDTTLTSFPTNPSSSSNASFGFTGSDTGGSGLASFQCKIDSGSYTTCTSPRSYTSLPDGSHTFMVRAVDGAGNIDPTPASYTWIIDATPPNTSIISTPPNLSASTAADFTFSGNDGGGTGVASFECRLDSGTFAACTSPHSYTGLSQGSHTFQVRAVDTLGQTDPTPASYTWVIDATAPDTTITAGPSNPSNSASATFSFSGSDPGGTGVVSFECRLDGAAFAACTSTQTYSSLSPGSHTFEVRAIDAAANVDATPASYTWVIDTTEPDTSIAANPLNPSASASATFSFSGSDPGGSGVASFECRLDGAAFAACTSPQSYIGLADGSHTFEVRAVDAAGNVDSTAATYTWMVDTTGPDTTITSSPANPSNSGSATFSFSGNDGGGTGVASFECRLDSGTFAACTSPHSYTGLSQSSHTFQVRAVDTLGQTDPTPASYTWVIDATAPDTTITSSPANPSNSASATFSFSGSDPGGTGVVSFECRLDGAAFAACTSPQSYIGLADGTHTFEVRAIDAAANVDATPASYTWVIDATAPDTTITANPTNPTSSANASFSFIASDNGGSGVASFECRLDGAAFAACTSTQTYSSLADGTHTFQVRAIDTLGNIGIPASYTWVVDTTGPDTTITAGPSNPSNSASATFSFSGNDGGGTGVASFECRLDGAAFAACTSPQSYTGLADGSHTFEVRAIDAAANVDATPASYTWAIDATAPSATFSSVAPDPTNTSPIPVTVTFSENVSGFTAADLVAGNGSVNNFAGSGSVYTFDLVPAGQGLVTVDIAAGVAQDSAGNGNSAATQFNRTYDSVAPTVTINQAAGQADPTGTSPIDFTVVFNEPVTGFGDSAADVTIGGTAGATTATVSGSGTTYTVAITGMTGTGTVVVSIPAGAAQDLGTNPNAASTSTDSTVDYDPVVPVATGIVRADPSPTSAASVQFTVTFSKNVTGVDAGDFALTTAGITGASITGVSGSGTTWTITVNTGSGDGTLRLDLVDDDSITDNAGNALGGSGAANGDFSAGQAYTIDKTAPNVVSIVRAGPNPTNASSVDFTLTTSESVTGVDLSDFGLTTSGTLTATSLASVSGSGTTWTITVNTGSGDGTLRLDLIDDDSIVDNVGNQLGGAGAQNVLTGEAYTIDRTGPDVTIDQAVGQNDPADTAPIRFTAIFGEAVTGFDAADVAIAGTAPGSLSAAIAETGPLDGTTYMVSISGMAGSGTVIVTIPANAASDMAGNGNNTSTGTDNTVTFVPSAPVVTGIVASGTNPTNAASVSFQVTFSEGVIGVDESDFALAPSGISGASITGVSGSGATWTVIVGTGSGDGTLGLNLVDDDSITSALTGIHLGDSGAGNGNFTGQQYAIDRTAPGVTSVNAVNVTAGAAATYTFIVTYADNLAIDASTLGNGDVIVSGPHGFSQPATLVAVDVAGDGSPRSATYSITAPGGTWDGTDNGSYAISVVAGGIADTASNLIAATQAGSFTVGVAYSIALPLVVSPIPVPAQLPDLVVESITTTGGSVQIVLRNQGTAPVGNGFWVDVYVNPDRAPTRVNETWNIVGTQGLVWGVTESIPAGGSLTLNVGDRFYHADASFVSGPISSGTTLYVQADSADTATSYGAVLESHEVAGAPYNNILGPVKAETTIRIAGQATGSQSPGLLPGRPKR